MELLGPYSQLGYGSALAPDEGRWSFRMLGARPLLGRTFTDDEGHAGGLGMVDRFLGLRHDAVGGGNDDDGDVRHLRATRPHLGKCLVAGGVEERDRLAAVFHPPGSDHLRDVHDEECNVTEGQDEMLEPRCRVSSEQRGEPGELNRFVDCQARQQRAGPHPDDSGVREPLGTVELPPRQWIDCRG